MGWVRDGIKSHSGHGAAGLTHGARSAEPHTCNPAIILSAAGYSTRCIPDPYDKIEPSW